MNRSTNISNKLGTDTKGQPIVPYKFICRQLTVEQCLKKINQCLVSVYAYDSQNVRYRITSPYLPLNKRSVSPENPLDNCMETCLLPV